MFEMQLRGLLIRHLMLFCPIVLRQFGVSRITADRAFRPSGRMSCLRGSTLHCLDPWVHVLFSLSISLAHGHRAVIFGSNN